MIFNLDVAFLSEIIFSTDFIEIFFGEWLVRLKWR